MRSVTHKIIRLCHVATPVFIRKDQKSFP